jgi:hypothetical protein
MVIVPSSFAKDVAPGTYELEATIDPHHALAEADRTNNTLRLTVQFKGPLPQGILPTSIASAALTRRLTQSLSALDWAGPGTGSPLPDLVALPPTDVRISTDGRGPELVFSSGVWNAGPQSLSVTAQRRLDGVLPAQQILHDGQRVDRLPIGTFVFDPRDGHDHWHFNRFATYRLAPIDRAGSSVASSKVGFCLGNVAPVDMSVRGAAMAPPTGGAGCGKAFSTSLSEQLAPGWSDVYDSSLPGQAIPIGQMPDGRYRLVVEVDPDGVFHEATRANNCAAAIVQLGTENFARTVEVVGLEMPGRSHGCEDRS